MSSAKPSVRTGPLRSRIEHASHPFLQALSRAPRATPIVLVLVVALIGALVRGIVGAICFGLLTIFLAWLLFLAWPRLTSLERLMRTALLLLTAVLTVVTAVPN